MAAMAPELWQIEAAIRNDAWMVVHYADQRTAHRRLCRAQAIQKLGLTVRHAFAVSDNFERLLAALIDGLRPRDERPF
jgi:hypothetical protein